MGYQCHFFNKLVCNLQWAEALTEGGGKVEWGDKWEENFSHGKGSKTGETWNIGHDGFRYIYELTRLANGSKKSRAHSAIGYYCKR